LGQVEVNEYCAGEVEVAQLLDDLVEVIDRAALLLTA
jgi:hypothetical protein